MKYQNEAIANFQIITISTAQSENDRRSRYVRNDPTGHPVKTEEDFKILQYMMENTVITENLAGFEAGYTALGEDAVTAPSIGLNQKTA